MTRPTGVLQNHRRDVSPILVAVIGLSSLALLMLAVAGQEVLGCGHHKTLLINTTRL
jgi:hypothetical protein